jgi:prepilin-type processing-associated H-X9-DG protein
MTDANKPRPDQRPTPFAWFLGAGGVLVAVFTAATFLFPDRATDHPREHRASCATNLKQLGLSLTMYATEDRGEMYPPLSPNIGSLSMASGVFYPEYMPDPIVNTCPLDSDRDRLNEVGNEAEWNLTPELLDQFFGDHSYFYLGYLVTNDNDMELFARAYRNAANEGSPVDTDYSYPDMLDTVMEGHLLRLREGIELALFKNDSTPSGSLQGQIPVLIERLGNHVPNGAHVLYMDGHVEFIEYPGKWPMTEKTLRILNELDALGTQN